MSKLSKLLKAPQRVWGAISELSPIFPSKAAAVQFKAALSRKTDPNRLFDMHWGGLHFQSRTVDYYGGVEDVFILDEYRFIEPILRDAQTATPVLVDAGANIGSFAIYALAILPKAIIHSLEPDAETFSILAGNQQLSHCGGWHVHQAAVWKDAGQITFASNSTSSTGNKVSTDTVSGNTITVPAQRLATIAQNVDADQRILILKMDIEGAEQAVLEQDHAVLDQVDNMIIEIHPEQVDEAQVLDMLRQHFPHVLPLARTDQDVLTLYFASRTYSQLPA